APFGQRDCTTEFQLARGAGFSRVCDMKVNPIGVFFFCSHYPSVFDTLGYEEYFLCPIPFDSWRRAVPRFSPRSRPWATFAAGPSPVPEAAAAHPVATV